VVRGRTDIGRHIQIPIALKLRDESVNYTLKVSVQSVLCFAEIGAVCSSRDVDLAGVVYFNTITLIAATASVECPQNNGVCIGRELGNRRIASTRFGRYIGVDQWIIAAESGCRDVDIVGPIEYYFTPARVTVISLDILIEAIRCAAPDIGTAQQIAAVGRK